MFDLYIFKEWRDPILMIGVVYQMTNNDYAKIRVLVSGLQVLGLIISNEIYYWSIDFK